MVSLKFFSIISVLFVSGLIAEEVHWPSPPNGYDRENANIEKGDLTGSVNYPTSDYGDRPCRIYMPPGFDENREIPYPVLYLHHGIGGNENAWVSEAGHAEGFADHVMDFLYAQEELDVTAMIVVMPYGNMVNTSGDSWENFEDVLINDLAPFIEQNYNGSSDPNHRAIAGLSMGGGQTLNFGYRNPDFFTWIGAFSPAPNTRAANQNIQDMDAVIENVHLNFLAAGTNESGFLNTARNYHNFLEDNGVENLYLQVEEGLGHERENWNRQLHNFAQRIFTNFDSTTTGIKQRISLNQASRQRKTLVRTPMGVYVLYPGPANSEGQVFSLDGSKIRLDVSKASGAICPE